MTTPTPPDATSESLFATWLERVEAGEQADLEELCREHPGHEAGLRALHRRWHQLQGAWDRAGREHEVADPLRKDAGGGGAPQGPVESEDPTPVDFSSEVLSRLVSKPLASTRYSIRDEVAQGGMGAVLRVWDEELRRPLAMKVMLGQGVAGASGDTPAVDPRLLARFLEEAQTTGQLDHPGIVPVHELGLDAEGRVYFTMKLVQGRTLREVFDELACGERGWTQTRVLGLVLKVCEAMSYAHAKGVIHRDLKPANVMVGRYGEAYVMDWGLAKVLGHEDDRDIRPRPSESPDHGVVTSERVQSAEDTPDSPLLTMDGDVVGTPAYMPPEQARGDLAAMGPHSDVYAVGAMLYHLLAGHMPYVPPGRTLSSRAIWERVQAGPPQPLQEVAPQAPPELVALCEKAMSREVGRRYPDMSALSTDLTAYVEGRVVHAYETGAWAEARKWIQRNKALAVSLAAAVLAVLVGAVAFALKADVATRAAVLASEEATRAQALASQLQSSLDVARARLLPIEADDLWPPHPAEIRKLESWITRAQHLTGKLAECREALAEQRALALPRSEEERRQERKSHPEFPRLSALQGELAAKRAALLQRRDGVPIEPPKVDWSSLPQDTATLHRLAWQWVRPERDSFGHEPEGLALVRRVLELTGDDAARRANRTNTLAWALFSLGRDDEALDASFAALEAAPEKSREKHEGNLAKLEAAVDVALSDEGRRAAGEEIASLERELAALEVRVDEQRNWRFLEEHADARWWNAQLTTLIQGLEELVDDETGLLSPDGLTPGQGWSVPRRLAFARELEAGFAQGAPYAES